MLARASLAPSPEWEDEGEDEGEWEDEDEEDISSDGSLEDMEDGPPIPTWRVRSLNLGPEMTEGGLDGPSVPIPTWRI